MMNMIPGPGLGTKILTLCCTVVNEGVVAVGRASTVGRALASLVPGLVPSMGCLVTLDSVGVECSV